MVTVSHNCLCSFAVVSLFTLMYTIYDHELSYGTWKGRDSVEDLVLSLS